ncbi:hypothetical protein KIN20_032534 [Parelaphostrongylus tenuis]|uniref:Globin family profile domain-containing protein n=1 Tax=Parelaphostrongylus tenuis TaxID=148309 RepID=A0AAD5R6Z8_PARTN|nr:hypothetical protein KIN20_032534 [Parelaphostrongylus tenuis]
MGNTKSAAIEVKHRESTSIKPKVSNASRRLSATPKKLSRSSTSSQGNRKPILTMNQRTIIKFCMDNSKDDIADRIIRRAMEKKDDFKTFIDNLPKTQRSEVTEALRSFLVRVCDLLTDSEEIQRVSEEFGASHVPFRTYGFKPDFFAGTADAVTTECTYLDQATHTPSETAGAWSTLSAFLFSAVRDGYYAELRRQRKASNAFRNRPSFDISSEGSQIDGGSRRSASPATDDFSQGSEPKENTSSFLVPPQGRLLNAALHHLRTLPGRVKWGSNSSGAKAFAHHSTLLGPFTVANLLAPKELKIVSNASPIIMFNRAVFEQFSLIQSPKLIPVFLSNSIATLPLAVGYSGMSTDDLQREAHAASKICRCESDTLRAVRWWLPPSSSPPPRLPGSGDHQKGSVRDLPLMDPPPLGGHLQPRPTTTVAEPLAIVLNPFSQSCWTTEDQRVEKSHGISAVSIDCLIYPFVSKNCFAVC